MSGSLYPYKHELNRHTTAGQGTETSLTGGTISE